MKKIVFTTFLVGFGVMVGLLLAEVVLRATGVSYPKFHTIDNVLGFVNNPGARGWFIDEGRGFVEFNSAGMRGPEYTVSKPDGVFRIAILGDSYTSALQVMREDSFPAIIARELKLCSPLQKYRIEVLNFGVSGYGTAQELILLREKVLSYSPDMVVLAFLSGNDIRDNSPELDDSAVPRPYFKIENASLIVDNSFQQSAYHMSRRTWKRKIYEAALARFKTVQLAARLKHLKMEKDRIKNMSRNKQDKTGDFLDYGIYGPPETPAMSAAWDITERLILEIKEESARHNSDFLLVTLTNPSQVFPDKQMNDVKNAFYPEERLSAFSDANNIPILTLARTFKSHADKTNEFLHGFGNNLGGGHWNKKGHALAGKLISEKICVMEEN